MTNSKNSLLVLIVAGRSYQSSH